MNQLICLAMMALVTTCAVTPIAAQEPKSAVVIGGTGAVVGTWGQEVTLPAGMILSLRLERQLVVDAGR